MEFMRRVFMTKVGLTWLNLFLSWTLHYHLLRYFYTGLNRFKIVVGNDFSITDEGCENFINPFLLFDKLTLEGVQVTVDTRFLFY